MRTYYQARHAAPSRKPNRTTLYRASTVTAAAAAMAFLPASSALSTEAAPAAPGSYIAPGPAICCVSYWHELHDWDVRHWQHEKHLGVPLPARLAHLAR